MKKRLLIVLLVGLLICFFACSNVKKDTSGKVNKADTSGMDFDFSDEKKPDATDGGKEVAAGMTITKEGTYKITGDFVGPVVIDAGKEDVQLILEDASITATDGIVTASSVALISTRRGRIIHIHCSGFS